MIGKTLGHYQITSQLGKGGMGEVYRAHDSQLGRDVAMKVLPEAFAASAERMGRFKREARVLASLNHPNIASLYGIEESGSGHALIMELVQGRTLAERTFRQNKLSIKRESLLFRLKLKGLWLVCSYVQSE